jgi:DNA-binding MarR family transcriptional regulator
MPTLTIKQAADRLGISESTVRRHLRADQLKGHQEPTPQGFVWRVELPNDEPSSETPSHAGSTELGSELEEALRETIRRQDATIEQLRDQLQEQLNQSQGGNDDAHGRSFRPKADEGRFGSRCHLNPEGAGPVASVGHGDHSSRWAIWAPTTPSLAPGPAGR